MSEMTDLLWVREQMSLRKLANQFLSKVKSTGVNRVLITSVQKGDGKARFMSEIAAEMSRVNQELVPLAAANLHIVNPDRFKDKLVVVYGPAYFEAEGLHTIPERWMRAFDAVVVVVMARRTRSRDLLKLINWLKDYNYQHIWPVLNEKMAPDISESWMRFRGKLGMDKDAPRRLSRGTAASVWQPLLPPQDMDDYPALPAHDIKDVIITSPATGTGSAGIQAGEEAGSKTKTVSSNPPAAVSMLLDDIDHTSTLQGPRRGGNDAAEGPFLAQPDYLQSARTTIRSSAPPTKSISDTPPKREASAEKTEARQTSRQFTSSLKATMISSVPPPSMNRAKSDPPQKFSVPGPPPDFMQTVRQYAPSAKATMISSVPPPSVKRINSDEPAPVASSKEKKER